MNDAFVEIAGEDREALLGDPHPLIESADTDVDVATAVANAIAEQEPTVVDVDGSTTGETRWGVVELAPVPSEATHDPTVLCLHRTVSND